MLLSMAHFRFSSWIGITEANFSRLQYNIGRFGNFFSRLMNQLSFPQPL